MHGMGMGTRSIVYSIQVETYVNFNRFRSDTASPSFLEHYRIAPPYIDKAFQVLYSGNMSEYL